MKYLKSLYVQVIIAILAGILLGALYPSFAVKLKPLGDGFIKLVKMMISPIIFCTIISGIAGMQDTRKLGRVGLKAIIYFEVITTLALIIGLILQRWILNQQKHIYQRAKPVAGRSFFCT